MWLNEEERRSDADCKAEEGGGGEWGGGGGGGRMLRLVSHAIRPSSLRAQTLKGRWGGSVAERRILSELPLLSHASLGAPRSDVW